MPIADTEEHRNRSVYRQTGEFRQMIYEGTCRLGDLFENRREKGRAGLPTLSVTLNNGLVNREELDRKQDTALTPEEHLLVKPGDIAYNMMRMWQGAFGLADQEGIVSPAYIVLRPKAGIDPLYASYLFKTARLLHLFWAYSYGLTNDRLRLYFDDFSRIPLRLPDLREQQRVGCILNTWDDALSNLRDQLALSRSSAKRLLHDLFSCSKPDHVPGGWMRCKFGDLFLVSNHKTCRIEQSRYLNRGRIPIVDQGQRHIAGFTDDDVRPLAADAIVFGDHTRAIKWIDFPFCPGADGTQVLRTKGVLLPKFGYYLLRSVKLPDLGYSRHMKSLKEATYHLPRDPNEQQRITSVLETADRRTQNLEQQLNLLEAEWRRVTQALLVVNDPSSTSTE